LAVAIPSNTPNPIGKIGETIHAYSMKFNAEISSVEFNAEIGRVEVNIECKVIC